MIVGLIVVFGVVLILALGIVCLWAERRVRAAPRRDQLAHLEGGRPRS